MTALPSRLLAVAALPAIAGVGVRLWNVFHYPADWGFDAAFNWRYIVRLTRTWALPAPHEAWSAADPPLYFYTSAALLRAGRLVTEHYFPLVLIPLLSLVLGLGSVALAGWLVHRSDPGDPTRALLAAGLVLFLPAHVHMSVMVNEEILATLLTSTAVALAALRGRDASRHPLARAGASGLAAGLALLTKLSGLLTVAAVVGTHALDALRARDSRDGLRRALACALLVAVVAGLSGGWYWARNRLEYGYFQPFGLSHHESMFRMPPGQRSWRDYLWIPAATFTDPQLLNPDLLHSVWGSTYATLWFDGHRYFLPADSRAVDRLGTLTLLLALLPTAAFAVGAARGVARTWRGGPDAPGADPPLLLLTFFTLAGYAWFSWTNPWFVTLKGTTLLGLALPYAYYASDELVRWSRGRAGGLVWAALAVLAVAVVVSSSYALFFPPLAESGLQWETGS